MKRKWEISLVVWVWKDERHWDRGRTLRNKRAETKGDRFTVDKRFHFLFFSFSCFNSSFFIHWRHPQTLKTLARQFASYSCFELNVKWTTEIVSFNELCWACKECEKKSTFCDSVVNDYSRHEQWAMALKHKVRHKHNYWAALFSFVFILLFLFCASCFTSFRYLNYGIACSTFYLITSGNFLFFYCIFCFRVEQHAKNNNEKTSTTYRLSNVPQANRIESTEKWRRRTIATEK